MSIVTVLTKQPGLIDKNDRAGVMKILAFVQSSCRNYIQTHYVQLTNQCQQYFLAGDQCLQKIFSANQVYVPARLMKWTPPWCGGQTWVTQGGTGGDGKMKICINYTDSVWHFILSDSCCCRPELRCPCTSCNDLSEPL